MIDLEIVTCKDSSDVLKGLEIAIKHFKPENIEKNVWEYTI
jgi:S-adenosylmethionine/arginine decarboxylase-like enzyme